MPDKIVSVRLASQAALEYAAAAARSSPAITPQDGTASVMLPQLKLNPLKKDCFGVQDLSVSESGAITLKTDEPLTLLTLENPPRLLLVAKPAEEGRAK
jgi:hypothetical protein